MLQTLSSKIDEIQNAMCKLPQQECSVVHHFAPGLYIREVRIPADTIAIGHYQKFSHLNIFIKGIVSIVNADESITRLEAPMIFTGGPGRKVGYIHSDVVWLNVYPTSEQDVTTLESMFIEKTDTAPAVMCSDLVESAKIDYTELINELGVTEEHVQEQVQNIEDQMALPYGAYKFCVSDSPIHGKGVFATGSIPQGEVIGPARIGGKRTPLGRYTNHSNAPNAKMVFFEDDIILVATKDIPGCAGGVLGEEIVVDYRDSIKLVTGGHLCLR